MVDVLRHSQGLFLFSTSSSNSHNFGFRWWAPSKFDPVKSPMLFFENGMPLIPPVPPDVGIDKVLKHMVWCHFLLKILFKISKRLNPS